MDEKSLVLPTSFEKFLFTHLDKQKIIKDFKEERKKRNNHKCIIIKSIASVYEFIKYTGVTERKFSLEEYKISEKELYNRATHAIQENKKTGILKKLVTSHKSEDDWEYFLRCRYFKAFSTPFGSWRLGKYDYAQWDVPGYIHALSGYVPENAYFLMKELFRERHFNNRPSDDDLSFMLFRDECMSRPAADDLYIIEINRVNTILQSNIYCD